jgi:Probable transposase
MSRLTVELPEQRREHRPAAVGIDVGLKRLARFRTGEGVENQAFLTTALKKLRQARREVARLHYRVSCLRDDVLHKVTSRLAECYGIIGIEDLNRKRAPQESALVSCVLRRRAGQAPGPARREGRAARRTGDQGGTLLPLQQDLPRVRLEMARHAGVRSGVSLPQFHLCLSSVPTGS